MTVVPEVPVRHERLKLLINGKWVESQSENTLPVMNPGTGHEICKVPFALKEEVDAAISSSADAFEKWRNVPLTDRVQYLFKIKYVLEEHAEELARVNSQNHGKTIKESRGDIRRTIENVEAAIGAAYTLLKGDHLDQISEGIDEGTVKEPLGVFALICPFNFPTMVPFWFLPYAIVAGCTVIVKPSEVTPVPMTWMAELIQKETNPPPGVVNLVHGSRETVEALIAHRLVKGVTFVGSTPVGRQIYKLAGEYGKRAIVQAGAKNSIVVMPDANLPLTIEACISSLFGNTGQRCLAGANVLATGGAAERLLPKLAEAARSLKVGYALDEASQMGPMVSKKAKDRVLKYVDTGLSEDASLTLDGRGLRVGGFEDGFYLGPTIFHNVKPEATIAKEEIFGPLATVIQTPNLDEAIDFINRSTAYGNAASIFTSNGANAREFRRRVRAGNIGINVGVAAPIAFFPFGGMGESFFGVLHGQIESIDFFTDRKTIITRWSTESTAQPLTLK